MSAHQPLPRAALTRLTGDLRTLTSTASLGRRRPVSDQQAVEPRDGLERTGPGRPVESREGREGAGNFPATPRYRFVFVNHVTTNPFFVPTQYGAEDASALLQTTFQWTGSKTSDVGEMVNAMNTAISGKVDGIAVAIVDPKAFNEPTQTALEAGIPVVSYNADDPNNPRLAYIGQDLYL